MSHKSGHRKHDDNECSGPRPPVPGEESVKKMTEGVAGSTRSSPPSYLNWARTLNHLLEDHDGAILFQKYVEEEAPAYNDHLKFYFACEGLKQESDPDMVKQIIGVIYRFLRKSQLHISEDLRRTIKAGLKNEMPLSANIYDPMQQHVKTTIRENIYPTFLSSEMFISYIQQMYERLSSGATGSGSGSSSGASCGSNGGGAAATAIGACALPPTISGITATVAVPPFINLPICSSSSSSGAAGGAGSTAGGPPAGTCSATGSVYGPSTSASSSGSVSATDTLPRSSTLPTLHEDSELTLCDDFKKLRVEGGRMSAEMPFRLTRNMLLATQERRLEIRPQGRNGYNVYPANTNTSYVPNSRVDSERASVSSGGRSDSDTMSLSSCSMDGRPNIQRRHSTAENKAIRQSALVNKETNPFQVIPRTQRMHSNEHRPQNREEFILLLLPKLEELKRQRELEDRARFEQAIREKFPLDEDNDQDILDQHVSRVWKDQTPLRSPGTMSPCPPLPSRRRITAHESGMLSDGAMSGHSMKHSKSMPDQSSSSRKLTNKWPSMNTDSGISLVSADTLMKYKDTSPCGASSSTASKLEEAKRRLEDETRRSRRYTQQQLPPMQPKHASSFSSSSSGSSSLHHQLPPPPPPPAEPQETTTVLYSFCDEEVPYRMKIPGSTRPTLKQFKIYLPKKGNYRFFFKTHCEDPDSPVIQEEIVNDSDILPLFEGKVMGVVKPSD